MNLFSVSMKMGLVRYTNFKIGTFFRGAFHSCRSNHWWIINGCLKQRNVKDVNIIHCAVEVVEDIRKTVLTKAN